MSVDVVILVEHTARELDIACALKYLAECRYGLSTIIATRYHDIQKTLRHYSPRAVVLPYCYAGGPWSDVLSRWLNIPYINLAYEQLFSTLTSDYKIPKGIFPKERILHVGWGEFYSNHLISHGVQPNNIIVNGNPSYTLYTPPYNRYFDTREILAKRYGLDITRRWVFVPENYGIVFVEPETLRGYAGAMGENTVQVWRKIMLMSFQAVTQWWKVAAESGNAEVIVRPRPAIPEDTFRAGVTNNIGTLPKHLHITKAASVKEWNLASDIVVSSYSTTLVEAAIAGKPVFMLEPITFPDFVHANWHDMVSRIKTQDDFLSAVTSPPPDIGLSLKKYAESIMMTKGDSINNLVNIIADVVFRRRYIPPTPGLESLPEELTTLGSTHNLWRFSKNLIRPIKERIFGQKIDSWHKDDVITPAEVAKRVARWGHVLKSHN